MVLYVFIFVFLSPNIYPSGDSALLPNPFSVALVRLLPLSLVSYYCLIRGVFVLISFHLHKGSFLYIIFQDFSHWCRRGLGINRADRHVVDWLCLGQEFLYCSFHCSLEGGGLEGLVDKSIIDYFDHRHYLGIRAGFRHTSCIAEASQKCILY